jgi:hypothetical protein
MRRTYLFLGLLALVTLAAVVVWRNQGRAQPANSGKEPAEAAGTRSLPLAQVILFSSGVGYFQREGEIDGNARVDLAFPVSDVNDLLKSLVLQDSGKGKVTAISYDSLEPVDKTLRSFALDLTSNPTFGQILNQARGEKVELTLQVGGGAAAGSVTGVIVGMESEQEMGKEVHQLNLLCAEGLRAVPLAQVQRIRFLNAGLDSEFRRALEVLATAHNSQKRSVSVHFKGEGRRSVKVGYVVENPIWKTSYRLVLDKTGKATLQGWALVENTSDEDWKDVRMALISSRPISFQMDLYPPLFIPRPIVEPERFASLRPPTYQGPLTKGQGSNFGGGMIGFGGNFGGGLGALGALGGGLGALGALGGGLGALGAVGVPGGGQPGQPAVNLGIGGGMVGMVGGPNLGAIGGQAGNRYQTGVPGSLGQVPRLTYEELQERRQEQKQAVEEAKKVGSAVAELDPTGVASAATGEEIGDAYRYTLDEKISLPRQKSAMLPIVDGTVETRKVSIYNQNVHPKFPLLGVKLKNTTGQTLMQGPVSVYEGGTYAGDSRFLDLQPGEERLVSYAIDQGTEVKPGTDGESGELTSIKIRKGIVRLTHKLRETTTYLIRNRSKQDRTLILEQPYREDWQLVEPEKSTERARDVYRFECKAPAVQTVKYAVVEEKTQSQQKALATSEDHLIRMWLNHTITSPKQQAALRKALDYKMQIAAAKRDLAQLEKQLKTITDDQARLRANLEKVPATSAAHKRYLEKFDKQETDIEKLQARIAEKQEAINSQQKEFDDYLAGLTIE